MDRCKDCPEIKAVDGNLSRDLLADHLKEDHAVTHIGEAVTYEQLEKLHDSFHREVPNMRSESVSI